MTATQTAILAAFVSSSILTVGVEFIGDKIFARLRYKGWQAVFLSTGQVYFGKVTSATRNDIRLTKIYYLKTSNEEKAKNEPVLNVTDNDVSLIKLGNELHAPEDLMIIGRAHIVFTENLKNSAQVVQAIEAYENASKIKPTKKS